MLVQIGLDSRTARPGVREQALRELAFGHPQETLARDVIEAAVIATCQRLELYVALPNETPVDEWVRSYLDRRCGADSRVARHLAVRVEENAVEHLFRVAGGLESAVVGEHQVLGQVRDGFRSAQDAGTIGSVLDYTFRSALTVGKRVRSEAGINTQRASLATAACTTLRNELGELAGWRYLILGAGRMAALVVEDLLAADATDITIATRTGTVDARFSTVRRVQVTSSAQLKERLPNVDVVIACTSAEGFVVTTEAITERNRPLLVIDLGMPRNVDPAVAGLANVRLEDVDGVSAALAGFRGHCERNSAAAEMMISEAVEDWRAQQRRSAQAPTIAALVRRADLIAKLELEHTLKRLNHLTERDRNEVTALARLVARQFIHQPVQYIRQAPGQSEAQVLRDLFSLDTEDAPCWSPERLASPTVGVAI